MNLLVSSCKQIGISPDEIVFWQYGFFKLNATIVFTWGLMLVLAVGSKIITRKLTSDHTRSRWQNMLDIVVTGIQKQIGEVGLRQPEKYLRFLALQPNLWVNSGSGSSPRV